MKRLFEPSKTWHLLQRASVESAAAKETHISTSILVGFTSSDYFEVDPDGESGFLICGENPFPCPLPTSVPIPEP